MISGHITHAGDLKIDGEKLTGVFVLCTAAELRNAGGLLFEDVAINKSTKKPCIECEQNKDSGMNFCAYCGREFKV